MTLSPEPQVIDLIGPLEGKAADYDLTVERGYVYVVAAEGLGLYKIGMATDVRQRLSSYRVACPVPVYPVLVASVPKLDMYEIEQAIHAMYEAKRVRGEWFALTDEELASLPDAIKKLAKRGLGQLEKEIVRTGTYRYDAAAIKRTQFVTQAIARIEAKSEIPTDELVLDRITAAGQNGELIDSLDLTRCIERKPRAVHDAIRSLILLGKVAIVSPRRNPNGGSVWLNDAYRNKPLILPDATCDWELTLCGHEILISEPPGRLVPEFFYKPRWEMKRG